MFSLYTAGAGVVNISSISSVTSSMLLFDMLSLVILSDPSISSSISIAFGLCLAVLSICGLYHNYFDICLTDNFVLFYP